MPDLVARLGDQIGIENLYERLAERAEGLTEREGVAGDIAGYTSVLIGALANLLLVIVAGVYLAIHPERYRRGILRLVPQRAREEAGRVTESR